MKQLSWIKGPMSFGTSGQLIHSELIRVSMRSNARTIVSLVNARVPGSKRPYIEWVHPSHIT
jgi:hypothetical protein